MLGGLFYSCRPGIWIPSTGVCVEPLPTLPPPILHRCAQGGLAGCAPRLRGGRLCFAVSPLCVRGTVRAPAGRRRQPARRARGRGEPVFASGTVDRKSEAPPERGLASTAPACTPDSVRAGASRPGPVPPSIWDAACAAPRAAYPSRRARGPRAAPPRRSAGLCGLAPRGVCLAAAVAGRAGGLLPHRFTHHLCPAGAGPSAGLLSVARAVVPPWRDAPAVSGARCPAVSGRSSPDAASGPRGGGPADARPT